MRSSEQRNDTVIFALGTVLKTLWRKRRGGEGRGKGSRQVNFFGSAGERRGGRMVAVAVGMDMQT